ncbi:uncharacterized protein ATNIH1004_005883 [Aspergillus tanneri]|uniref:Uncharacterized protein n=1 Tax=Aspergillus tanneri TaxID=1220188 RepID=A0A5M9MQG6_9EURO|nr:uncharacterized protein ATNIH1004_005883 [Aspergillus tanneri]KAA8647193.1 hypothetical protein ATNIH1004_005883 [Aspergillus tanneri]
MTPVPNTSLARRVQDYAREHLPACLTMKYYYVRDSQFADETYFLTVFCMISAPRQRLSAPLISASRFTVAEGAAEAIIRHQDPCKMGSITTVGQLIPLASILVRVCIRSWCTTILCAMPSSISRRCGGANCFGNTVLQENRHKPWAHTTTLGEDDFPDNILGNAHAAPFEQNER